MVGDAKDAQEAIIGTDMLTGETLTPGERIMSGGAAALPFVSGPVVRGTGKVVSDVATEIHHMLPRQFDTFFKRVGLDIENYTISMPKADHRLKPDGVHTGTDNWNSQWKDFFDNTVNATKEQILTKLDDMKKFFKID